MKYLKCKIEGKGTYQCCYNFQEFRERVEDLVKEIKPGQSLILKYGNSVCYYIDCESEDKEEMEGLLSWDLDSIEYYYEYDNPGRV